MTLRAQRIAMTWGDHCWPRSSGSGVARRRREAAPCDGGAASRADPDPAGDRTSGPTTGRYAECALNPSKPDSFIELQEALTAARGRLEELSRAAEAVAATGQLQQELAALQAENQKLRAEIEAAQAERGELATAKQTAEARVTELTKTVEQATAKAREMGQELVAVRWQNAQLNTSLAQARTSGDQMEAEARATQTGLRKRIEELRGLPSRRPPKRRACASRPRPANNASRLPTRRDRSGSTPERAAHQPAASRTGESERRRRSGEGAGRAGERQAARGAGASRDGSASRCPGARARRVAHPPCGRRRGARRSETSKAQLESEVAELREAADAATDAARENLIAVEDRIRELNEALGAIGPGGGPLETDPALLAESGAPPEHKQAEDGGRATAPSVANVAAVATPSQGAQPGAAEADLQRIKTASVTHPDNEEEDPMVADLPLEKRLQCRAFSPTCTAMWTTGA